MSSMINLKVAEANTAELRRLAANVDAHPFSRFVYLAYRERAPRR
jgi:hypothetical protein